MPWNLNTTHAQAGDLVQLVGLRHKHFIFTLQPGGTLQTHRGILNHDDLIGLPWGSQVFSHLGSPFFLLQPMLGDILNELPRNTQILYPKEIGFVLVTMGIGNGQRVIEAGTGSGAMTTALAFAVGSQGRVYSYERRPEMQNLARKNLARLGLDERVTFKLKDIAEGLDETNADAFFLDVPAPYDYIGQVRAALKPGGFFCSIVPTFNQAEKLLYALRRHKFAFLEMCEVLLRYYKPEPMRLRPTDRMVAHTGFLVFARRVEPSDDPRAADLLAEAGMFSLLEKNGEDVPADLSLQQEFGKPS
ncbi:MAG: tRNA (adenine-N1)-methyltransferase [Anaerolineales bacterium]|nr:tRNA (adenine-N1)-methyltransferase [Anaerolineales bacterium]MDW8276688.1 tRNA (adenine-N1)-methyltransferase [Anaerolineales bacterium]